MGFKLGDLVIKKNETNNMIFQITEFDGDYVVIRGITVPVITVAKTDKLIKINRKRRKLKSKLRIIK